MKYIHLIKAEKVQADYELQPNRDSRKSFYGKARVVENGNGVETLYSYNTPIISIENRGGHTVATRLWDGYSQTTGRHIREFCGLSKAQFLELPLNEPTEIN